MMLKRWIVALAALCATAAASPAAAEWKRAESERFIVYSQGNEASLRRYVQKLETFDYILRLRMGLSTDAPPRKFPIYLLRGRRDLTTVYVGAPDFVAGVYYPREEDIFAIALAEGGDEVILHEYFHHLSHQTGGMAAYPGWLVEGLAEYYMTADIREGEMRIGRYDDSRASWLLDPRMWIPLDVLLTQRPLEITRSSHRNTYYPVAWLLTHWFMNDATRRPMLAAYVRDVAAGGDPVEAMQRVTGLDMPGLKRELRNYMDNSITITRYNFERPPAEVTITTLPASADDLLLLAQRLKVGVPEDEREATAAEVRRIAARHPNDPFALLQLGHAELHFGDAAAGETVLMRLLESEPTNIEALQLMATRRIGQARELEDDRDTALPLVREARGFLTRAYEADPLNYYTLILLANTRQWSSSYPNENDLLTWDNAFALAPQLTGIRFGYGSALMRAGRNEEAIIILEPVANAPHGAEAAQMAQQMIESAREGLAPPDDDALEAAAEAPPEPEPERPAAPGQGEGAAGDQSAPSADTPGA